MTEEKNVGVGVGSDRPKSQNEIPPEAPPQIAEQPPIIIQIPAPVQRKKREQSSILGVVLALLVIGGFVLVLFILNPGSQENLATVMGFSSAPTMTLKIKAGCGEGITQFTHLEFVNKPIQGKDFTQASKVPTLKETDSCIFFDGPAMASMLDQKIMLKDSAGKENELTGAKIFADKIAKATTLELGKDIKNSADKKWTDDLYFRILPILDAKNFKTTGEFSYLILPGYLVSPTPSPTPFQVSTKEPKPYIEPTEMILAVDIPVESTPTVEMTPTPLPTDLPRPTLEIFVTQVNQALATQMVIYDVTPVVYPTSTPANNAVSLEYYINNVLNSRPSCSPLSANYYTRWGMDNVVTLFMNIDCADGIGPVFYVQIPADIAARHVADINYPQIYLSQYPAKLHGPGLDVGGGYSLQPFK